MKNSQHQKAAVPVAKKPVQQITSADPSSTQLVSVNGPQSVAPLPVEQNSSASSPKGLQLETKIQKHFLRATQSDNLTVAETLIQQLHVIVSRFTNTEDPEALVVALQMLEDLAPEGTAQALLAIQMIGAHLAAVRNLGRAATPDITVERAESHTYRATRLMRLSLQQQELWAKLKGKTGAQRVLVEHVHVNSGGQAIVSVGAVTAGGRGKR